MSSYDTFKTASYQRPSYSDKDNCSDRGNLSGRDCSSRGENYSSEDYRHGGDNYSGGDYSHGVSKYSGRDNYSSKDNYSGQNNLSARDNYTGEDYNYEVRNYSGRDNSSSKDNYSGQSNFSVRDNYSGGRDYSSRGENYSSEDYRHGGDNYSGGDYSHGVSNYSGRDNSSYKDDYSGQDNLSARDNCSSVECSLEVSNNSGRNNSSSKDNYSGQDNYSGDDYSHGVGNYSGREFSSYKDEYHGVSNYSSKHSYSGQDSFSAGDNYTGGDYSSRRANYSDNSFRHVQTSESHKQPNEHFAKQGSESEHTSFKHSRGGGRGFLKHTSHPYSRPPTSEYGIDNSRDNKQSEETALSDFNVQNIKGNNYSQSLSFPDCHPSSDRVSQYTDMNQDYTPSTQGSQYHQNLMIIRNDNYGMTREINQNQYNQPTTQGRTQTNFRQTNTVSQPVKEIVNESSAYQPGSKGQTPPFKNVDSKHKFKKDSGILNKQGQFQSNLPTCSKEPDQEHYNNKQQTSVDLKKYLAGTFKPGYISALGLNFSSEYEGVNKYIGNYQPPVSESFPSLEIIMRFRDTPATPKELRVMFAKFVIFFGVKIDSELEKDPLMVIQESFYNSDRFGILDVEDHQPPSPYSNEFKDTCVLRWKGVMLAKAGGYSQADARKKAAISLINSLAHTCYTVQTKYSYYCGGKLPKFMLKTPEKPGVYKLVSKKEIMDSVVEVVNLMKEKRNDSFYVGKKKGADSTNISVVLKLIDNYFSMEIDSVCELIFGGKGFMEYSLGDLRTIAEHVSRYDFLQWRSIKGYGRGTYIGVSRIFSAQQLKSYLIAVQDCNIRYKLLPPQEEGIDLLMFDCQYSHNINKIVPGIEKPMPINRETPKRSNPFFGGRNPAKKQDNKDTFIN